MSKVKWKVNVSPEPAISRRFEQRDPADRAKNAARLRLIAKQIKKLKDDK